MASLIWSRSQSAGNARPQSGSTSLTWRLVFLLYAVQGSLAAQIEVLRHGDGVIFYVAAIALVSTNLVCIPWLFFYIGT